MSSAARARQHRLRLRWTVPVRIASAVAAALVVLSVALPSPSGGDTATAQAPTTSTTPRLAELEVMLVIDVSGSMRPAIESAKSAARAFVGSMPAAVPIGLQTFGDRVSVLSTPTLDRAQLLSLIDGISLEEDTALFDAVVVAAQQFTAGVEDRAIVLLSDGRDEGSRASLVSAVTAVQGVRVEAISLTTEQTDLASLAALGAVTAADDQAGVAAAFDRISGLLTAVVEPPPTTVPPTTPPTTVPPTTVAVAATPVPRPTVADEATPALPTVRAGDAAPSSVPLWIGGAGIFLGLFVFVFVMFPRQRVSRARLGIEQSLSVSEVTRRTAAAVDSVLEKRGTRREFATTLAVADVSMRPGEFVALVGATAVVSGLVGMLLGGPVFGLVLAAAVCLGARLHLRRRAAKRRAAFAAQLPDVLQLITTALRSGFGLTQALDVIAAEVEEPARSEFAQVIVEARLGRDLPGAMHSLATRMQSDDLEWVVSAIDINRDVGGNLSEVLTAVGGTIRERQRMKRQVATYTAEGRLSALVLTAMPFVMALWQWRTNPDNFERLFQGGGLVALIIGSVLLALGSLWVRRIVNSISI